MTDVNLNAATAYTQMLGWRIFPIHYKSKVPITKHGFKDATNDIEQIKRWWSQYPKAGIGLPTGEINNITVIDIDPRNGGHISFDRLIDEHEPFPDTVECLTAGGGSHFYFKYDQRINETEIKDYSGIDIQNNGQYVILPPSTHPETDKLYCWEESSKPVVNEISDIPSWFVELAQKKEHASGKYKAKPATEYVRLLQGVTEGERNNALMSLIGHLITRLDYREAFEIVHIWNESRVNPPLEKDTVTRAFNNILQKEARKR